MPKIRQEQVMQTLLAAGAKTANFTTSQLTDRENSHLIIYVDCTAVSGTTPTLDLFLNYSWDGGTTWKRLRMNSTKVMTLIDGGGISTDTFGDVQLERLTAALSRVYIVPILLPDMRLEGVVGGTTPSFTLSIQAKAIDVF